MIKNIIFDLSEVIISGYHGVENIVEQNTNISSEEFLKRKKETIHIFIDAMRGRYTEDEYIEALIENTDWNVNKEIIKKSIRKNLDTKVEGTIKIVESIKEKYNLILLYNINIYIYYLLIIFFIVNNIIIYFYLFFTFCYF